MIVCLCRGVSDRQVRLAIANGAASLREVAATCHAGRGCGACHEQIEGMLPAQPMANDNRACPAECAATCRT